MSERIAVPGDNAWHNIGTGPATVQNLTDGVSIMVVCNATQPAVGPDGMVLTGQGANHTFQSAATLWAQVVQKVDSMVAVQPE